MSRTKSGAHGENVQQKFMPPAPDRLVQWNRKQNRYHGGTNVQQSDPTRLLTVISSHSTRNACASQSRKAGFLDAWFCARLNKEWCRGVSAEKPGRGGQNAI